MNLRQPYYIEKRKNNLDLCGEWDLAYTDAPTNEVQDLEWNIKTQVPNSIFWSLYEAGILPHPYEKCNSKLYRWVDEKVWYYRKHFHISDLPGECVAILCADGAAYYSRIWLNGRLIGEHEGMFGGPFAQVEDYLKFGSENEIIIEIKACNYGKKDGWDPWNGNGENSQIVPWNIARDTFTSNGDFIVLGLWQGVRIELLKKLHMSRPYLVTKEILPNSAKLSLKLEITDGTAKELATQKDIMDGGYTRAFDNGLTGIKKDQTVNVLVKIVEKESNHSVYSHQKDVVLYDHEKSGIDPQYYECQFYNTEITIENPKLWYPNTLGEPFLYTVMLTLLKDDMVYDTLSFDYGIRTIELGQTAGEQYRARWDKFQFIINGESIFLKGMNWMPIDFLYKTERSEYEWVLGLAKNAGIQLLRVWSGGGMPETDDFYEICDRLGLMVWQDSFIANMNTPNWPQDVLQAQVCMNLYRIRNHPSLALHCGGNEFNPYSIGNAASMFVIERNIQDLDPTRPFKRTTADMGSAHIYRDMEPTWYRHLYKQLPFVGESGIHSFPNAKSLRQLLSKEEYNQPLGDLLSEAFKDQNPELINHFTEYLPERIPRMLSRASQITDMCGISLDRLAEATQIASCEFYQIMIESMRENFPVTAGIMPWVFKRPWTTVGIQLVDGLGEPVAPYYYMKNAYNPILAMVCLERLAWAPGETASLTAKVIYDGHEKIKDAELELKVFDRTMKLVLKECHVISIIDYLTEFFTEKLKIPYDFADSFFFVTISLKKDGLLLSRSVYWPKCLKKLEDKKFWDSYTSSPSPNMFFDKGPWLKYQLEQGLQANLSCNILLIGKEGKTVKIEMLVENLSETPAFPVSLIVTDDKTLCAASDNYFFLDANERKKIILEIDCKDPDIDVLNIEISAWNAQKIKLKGQVI